MMQPNDDSRVERLYDSVRGLRRVIVAFSAGVDSTVLLKVALDVLGRDNVLAVTGVSPSLAARELESVRQLAALLDAPLELIETAEMSDPNYAANPAERCYYCKNELFTKLNDLAGQRGYHAVLCGVNADDTGDFRPGIDAARKMGVRMPLLDAGLTKNDIRALARRLGLPNWQKPALACLASRIPYGTPITIASLSQVEKAENFLYDRGFSTLRVRHHQKLARIEVPPDDMPRLLAEPLRSELIAFLKGLGYTYITLDIQGFRSGSANEALARSAGKAM